MKRAKEGRIRCLKVISYFILHFQENNQRQMLPFTFMASGWEGVREEDKRAEVMWEGREGRICYGGEGSRLQM